MKKTKLSLKILEELIDTSPVAMFIVNRDRDMVYANKSYAKLFGYELEEVFCVNARVFHVSDESYKEFGKKAFNYVLDGVEVATDFQVKKKDGTLFWIHIVGILIEGQDLVFWTIFDINKRKEAEKILEELNYNFKQYLNAIDNMDIGIFVVDDDFSIRYMNNTMKKWFGDQEGKVCYSAVANLDTPCPYCKLSEVVSNKKKVIYEPTTPDGQSFEIFATFIKNSDGTYSKMEIIRNITEQKLTQERLLKHKEELIHQAHHDSLTGLPNRILFNDRLEQGIENSKRSGKKLALFFIDLDNFKEINDSLGHDVGDIVLQNVTKKLSAIVRGEDSIARLGGDEFTLIMQNLKHGQDASILAQKILKKFSKPIVANGNKLYVSCSIGISLYPDDGDSVQNLLKYADSAMYRAKEEGRNNFQFYSSDMTELAFERVVMETSLRAALKHKDFVVYFQPQIDAKEKKLIGMEALVRWNHSVMGIVSPAKFIPLAESSGLIIELDRFVMKSAMTQLAKWYEDGLNPGVLSLNLSVKQLKQKDFIDVFKKMMKKSGCKPEWLEFEVTESQIMTNPQEAIKILNSINELGVRLAVDDFGTGYSSLAYLKKLPIHKLKIDRSFVRDLPDDSEDAGITKAVIALAKSLNLDTIAEGVETKEQKDFIVENGCRNIQGYFYSRPLCATDMESFLKDDIISKIKD
jgi:diguanylate cyclase (GGDEF)-like protein/PAS domain S-box-containing protein